MWALIVEDVVREVTDIDPTGRFHPSLSWVDCDAEVVSGNRYEGGVFEPANAENPAASERAWRDGEIAAHEWLISRHRAEIELQRETTLTTGQYTELLQYLQALRDWPAAEAFPDSTQRPANPPWLAEQTQ